MQMYFTLAPILLCWFLPAASALAAESFTTSPAYEACATLATTDAAAALKKAEDLGRTDSSIGSAHCRAMALYGLRRYQEAGEALDEIFHQLPEREEVLRSYVTRQAARAWVEAGQYEKARRSLSAQIASLTPRAHDQPRTGRQVSELLLDRAGIHMKQGQTTDAVQDLDHALSLRPNGEDLLLARAELLLAIGDKALAQEDLQRILRMNPRQPQALAKMRQLKEK